MAVEDGATLGRLLGLAARSSAPSQPPIPAVLGLFESLRKRRTTLNVAGAKENRVLYHLKTEAELRERDAALAHLDWDKAENDFSWLWGDMSYMRYLNGFDTLQEAEHAFWERFGGGNGGEHRDVERKKESFDLETKLQSRVAMMKL